MRFAFEEEKMSNKRLSRAKFEDVIAGTIKPIEPETGHWRIFARPDHVERVKLVEWSDDE